MCEYEEGADFLRYRYLEIIQAFSIQQIGPSFIILCIDIFNRYDTY